MTTVHRPLKIVALNANGIGRQAYEVRKQLQDLEIDMVLFSETQLKPHMRYYIPNYDIYRTTRDPKCKTAVNWITQNIRRMVRKRELER
jgi:hypothetical protein